MIGQIEVTGVPLEAIVRAAYNPSRPQGLGHLHFQAGDLTDEEVSAIIGRFADSSVTAVGMDYVKGRSVKMTVRKDKDGRHFIKNRWYDHGDSALREFLKAVGLDPALLDKARAEEEAHISACVQAAVEFLRNNDSRYVMGRNDSSDSLPPMVHDGLYYGIDRKQIKNDWRDGDQIWTLAA